MPGLGTNYSLLTLFSLPKCCFYLLIYAYFNNGHQWSYTQHNLFQCHIRIGDTHFGANDEYCKQVRNLITLQRNQINGGYEFFFKSQRVVDRPGSKAIGRWINYQCVLHQMKFCIFSGLARLLDFFNSSISKRGHFTSIMNSFYTNHTYITVYFHGLS